MKNKDAPPKAEGPVRYRVLAEGGLRYPDPARRRVVKHALSGEVVSDLPEDIVSDALGADLIEEVVD